MKSVLQGLVLVFATCQMSWGWAAAANKVATPMVNMQGIIVGVDEGKAARGELEKEITAKDAEFTKQKKELDRLNEEWHKQKSLLSEEARMKKQEEFQGKFMAQRNAEGEFQASIKRKEMEAAKAIGDKASKIIGEIAKERGYPTVSFMDSSPYAYVETPIDITEEVIKRYNAREASSKKPGSVASLDKPSAP